MTEDVLIRYVVDYVDRGVRRLIGDDQRIRASALATGAAIDKSATAQVQAAVQQRTAGRQQVAEYEAIAAAAARGSEQQIAAYRLAADAATKYGLSVEGGRLSQAAMSSELRNSEKELGRTVRGAVAASGAFSGMGRALTFASGAFLGGAALSGALRSVLSVTKDVQASSVALYTTVKATGQAVGTVTPEIERLTKRGGELGFTTTETNRALTAFVRITHGDMRLAALELADAEDLARARGVALSTATLAVLQANRGVTSQLARLGIIVQPVVTAENALKDSHAKVTAEVRQSAKAWDREQTVIQAVRTIHKQYAGEAQAYTTTLAGSFAREHSSLEALQVTLGQAFMPVLLEVTNGVANYLHAWVASGRAQKQATLVAHDFDLILHSTLPVVKTFAVYLNDVAQLFGGWGLAFQLVLSGYLFTRLRGLVNIMRDLTVGSVLFGKSARDVSAWLNTQALAADKAALANKALATSTVTAATGLGAEAIAAKGATAVTAGGVILPGAARGAGAAGAGEGLLAGGLLGRALSRGGLAGLAARASRLLGTSIGPAITYTLLGSLAGSIAKTTVGGSTGALLGSVGKYAGVGAALGSVIPGVGTGIGALAGATTGLLLHFSKLGTQSDRTALALQRLAQHAGTLRGRVASETRGVQVTQAQLAQDRVGRDAARQQLVAAQAGVFAARGTHGYRVALDTLISAQNQYDESVRQVHRDENTLIVVRRNLAHNTGQLTGTQKKITAEFVAAAVAARNLTITTGTSYSAITLPATAAQKLHDYIGRMNSLHDTLLKTNPELAKEAGYLASIAGLTGQIPTGATRPTRTRTLADDVHNRLTGAAGGNVAGGPGGIYSGMPADLRAAIATAEKLNQTRLADKAAKAVVSVTDSIVASVDRNLQAVQSRMRARGIDATSPEGLRLVEAADQAVLAQLDIARQKLEAALARARAGAASGKEIRVLQGKLQAVGDKILQVLGDITDAVQAELVAVAQRANDRISAQIQLLQARAGLRVARTGVDTSSAAGIGIDLREQRTERQLLLQLQGQIQAQLARARAKHLQNAVTQLTQMLDQVQLQIIGVATQTAQDLRARVEAVAQRRVDIAQQRVSLLQTREQLMEVRAQLGGATPAVAAAQGAAFIQSTVIPAMRRQLAAERRQLRAELRIHDVAGAERTRQDIANQQLAIAQAQLDAQNAIKANTAKVAQQLTGPLSFEFGGQMNTDLVAAGTGV